MNIKFKKLNENAKLPSKGSEESGAWDVYASEIIKKEKDYYIVRLGFSTEIPNGYRMMASARSGLTKTKWYIPNSPCIIDSDYRGCWEIRFRGVIKDNHIAWFDKLSSYDEFPYKVGDRIAQIYLEKIIDIEFEEVMELQESIRGDGGFGSTGVN